MLRCGGGSHHYYLVQIMSDRRARVQCCRCGGEWVMDVTWLEAILPAAIEEARLFWDEGFVVLSGRMIWAA